MPIPPTVPELKQLAQSRLDEAKTLRRAEHFAGAWYLAGYAVELALKAIVCRTLQLTEYPDQVFRVSLKTHSPEDPAVLAGLSVEPDGSSRIRDLKVFGVWSFPGTCKTGTWPIVPHSR